MAKQFNSTSMHLRAMVILMVILICGSGIAKAAESDTVGVRVVIDDESNYYQTAVQTVGEFLQSENIELDDTDVINVDLDDELKNAMRIVISKPFEVTVIVDGVEETRVETNTDTIGKLILQLRDETGLDYRTQEGYASSTKLEKDMTIELNSVTEELTVETEAIPYETQEVETDELYVGETRVKQAGVEGTKETTIKTIFVGGEFSDSYAIERKVTVEPISEIIEIGTKEKVVEVVNTTPALVAPNGMEAKKVLTMNASAYCPCSKCCGSWSNGRTANGMKAGYGVVAVDTKVIPLGTKLYVEGYGYCIAADKGSAIKGNKIDLCYDSHSAALAFGRNSVKVYVLS